MGSFEFKLFDSLTNKHENERLLNELKFKPSGPTLGTETVSTLFISWRCGAMIIFWICIKAMEMRLEVI